MMDGRDSIRQRTVSETASVRTDMSNCPSPSVYEDGDEEGSEYYPMDEYILGPVDGGYAWVIVFCSFMCNLIVDGTCYTFGVFIGDFVNEFAVGKGVVAWAGSLLAGVYMTVGPFVGALSDVIGCRLTLIIGAIIGCLSFVLASQATNIYVLFLTYGVMGGIGLGLIYLPALMLVNFYFEKKRAMATGIAVCGSGFGTFLCAPFAAWLQDSYGWRGAHLIIGGLVLNCCVFGALMRPLQLYHESKDQTDYEGKREQEVDSLAGSHSAVYRPEFSYDRRRKGPLNTDPGVHSNLNLEQVGDRGSSYALQPIMEETNYLTVTSQSQLKDVVLEVQKPNDDEEDGATASETKVVNEPDSLKKDPIGNGIEIVKKNSENKVTTNGTQPPNGLPRNMTQPVVAIQRDSIRKNDSMPIIENKFLAPARSISRASFSRTRQQSIGDNHSEYSFMFTARATPSIASSASLRSFTRPLTRKDIFYSGSIKNIPEFNQSQNLSQFRQSMMSIPRSTRRFTEVIEEEAIEEERNFFDALWGLLGFSLLKDKKMALLAISSVFGMLGFYVPFVYIIDAAVSKGIDSTMAGYLLSIIGVTNIVGRLLSGYSADMPSVDSLLVTNICIALSGVFIFCVPLVNGFAGMAALAGLFGLVSAAFIALTSIVLVDLFGIDELTKCFGIICIFRGLAAIVGPPIAGFLYDTTGSYDIPFYVAGGFLGLSAIFSFLIPVVQKCCDSDNTQSKKSPETENFLEKNQKFANV
ncbi:monocarboxylate transporter 14-like [Artemia franciscana]|uniref:Major facilitator superfamily (MFS) profile domain-containing protein n=1 Tax=Artemia franciscana TaxID=6661 RepID=A0AA88IF88_ARTSF|nr:hypothetical protein QYM36_008169 [Artemia franciscana]